YHNDHRRPDGKSPSHGRSAGISLETMPDEPILREQARAALQERRLPTRPPDRTWGGKGQGQECSVCRKPITRDENGLEIEFDHAGAAGVDRFFIHPRCFAAWEFERTKMAPKS